MVAGEGGQTNNFRDRNIDDEGDSDDEESGHGEEDDLLGQPLSEKQLALLYGDVSDDEEVE